LYANALISWASDLTNLLQPDGNTREGGGKRDILVCLRSSSEEGEMQCSSFSWPMYHQNLLQSGTYVKVDIFRIIKMYIFVFCVQLDLIITWKKFTVDYHQVVQRSTSSNCFLFYSSMSSGLVVGVPIVEGDRKRQERRKRRGKSRASMFFRIEISFFCDVRFWQI
jgi:hypothetical protein